MKHAIRHIHFVGVAGAGMSGIAEVLLNLGYVVSGSDMCDSVVLQRLGSLGVRVFVGHSEINVLGADALVQSTAVNQDNVEVVAARNAGVPVVSRALMLAELMRLKRGIAIAGTHGKTTTTSLVSSILAHAGLDPTFVIGGLLNSAGTNAKLGSGEFIVVEADESDGSFLSLLPTLAVVTNIDEDHMETYGHDRALLDDAFVNFLHRLPFYGAAIVCGDDQGILSIAARVNRPITLFGLGKNNHVRATAVKAQGTQMQFRVHRSNNPAEQPIDIVLNLTGVHNVLNALAAIAVAFHLKVPRIAIQEGLRSFGGVGRRFESHGDINLPNGGHAKLIDDYGHHPVEIAATIAAARGAYPNRRLVLAFQPHRYTRTRDCFDAFLQALGAVDVVLITEVYAAGEAPITNANGLALALALQSNSRAKTTFFEDVYALPKALLDTACDGDLLLCMGAGSIGDVARKTRELAEELNVKKI